MPSIRTSAVEYSLPGDGQASFRVTSRRDDPWLAWRHDKIKMYNPRHPLFFRSSPVNYTELKKPKDTNIILDAGKQR